MMNLLKRRIKSAFNLIVLKCRERTFNQRMKYLYMDNASDTLMVVFSAFSTTDIRTYNYVRGLKRIKFDKLYILDVWGYKGSYYLFENGEDYPKNETILLINNILKKKKYKHIYTAGTSKGGTAAIFFGLELNASMIFAGACQYNLGTYLTLPEHTAIFRGMMGESAGKKEIETLNHIMQNQLLNHSNSNVVIHLIYSKNEITYKADIVGLLEQLKKCKYNVIEKEYFFVNHADVGQYFINYMQTYFLHN